MVRALVYVVPIALAIFALFDLARSLPEERVGVPRLAWTAVIVLVPVLGPLLWIIVSRASRTQSTPRPRPPMPGRGPMRPPTRRPGPIAPDDDPDFLWRLEQQRRRSAGEPPSEDPESPA